MRIIALHALLTELNVGTMERDKTVKIANFHYQTYASVSEEIIMHCKHCVLCKEHVI